MEKLDRWLKENNTSRPEFATRLGVHRSTLHRWLDPEDEALPLMSNMRLVETITGGQVKPVDWYKEKQSISHVEATA